MGAMLRHMRYVAETNPEQFRDIIQAAAEVKDICGGYIYVCRVNLPYVGGYKIGQTADIKARMATHRRELMASDEHVIRAQNLDFAEKALHYLFQHKRLYARHSRELFGLNSKEVAWLQSLHFLDGGAVVRKCIDYLDAVKGRLQ